MVEKQKKGLPQHKAQELRNNTCSLSFKMYPICLKSFVPSLATYFYISYFCWHLPHSPLFHQNLRWRRANGGQKRAHKSRKEEAKTKQVQAEMWGCCPESASGAGEVWGRLCQNLMRTTWRPPHAAPRQEMPHLPGHRETPCTSRRAAEKPLWMPNPTQPTSRDRGKPRAQTTAPHECNPTTQQEHPLTQWPWLTHCCFTLSQKGREESLKEN